MKKEKINIGNFNEQITWRNPTAAKSSFGDVERSFEDYKTVYAEVNPVSLGESEISSRMQYTETYTFTSHFDSAITTKYQIKYNNEDYNILKIEKLNLNRFIRATAIKKED